MPRKVLPMLKSRRAQIVSKPITNVKGTSLRCYLHPLLHIPRVAFMPFKVLDADFFPHIVDLVFAHASPPALLALRVNREWQRRAERQLAYHVCVVDTQSKESPSKIVYHLITSQGCEPIYRYTSTALEDCVWTVFPSFLSSTVVVDMDILEFNSSVARIL